MQPATRLVRLSAACLTLCILSTSCAHHNDSAGWFPVDAKASSDQPNDLVVVVDTSQPPDAARGKFSVQQHLFWGSFEPQESTRQNTTRGYEKHKTVLTAPRLFCDLAKEAGVQIGRQIAPPVLIKTRQSEIVSGLIFDGLATEVTIKGYDEGTRKGTFDIDFDCSSLPGNWVFSVHQRDVPFTAGQPVVLRP